MIGRVPLQHGVDVRQTLVGAAPEDQGKASGRPRLVVEPVERQRLVEVGQRLVVLVHGEICRAALGKRIALLRRDFDRTIEIGNGIRKLSLHALDDAAADIGRRVVRIHNQRAFDVGHACVDLLQAGRCHAPRR